MAMKKAPAIPWEDQLSYSSSTPVIILTRPQLAENIGATARAMLNCGLHDMRLVAPREPWPNQRAIATAAGADSVLARARLFPDLGSAVADLQFVIASTARLRDLALPKLTPHTAAAELTLRASQGIRQGVIFGPERSGLDNEDLTHAEAIVHMPLNPRFLSLNLAQAVLLLGYEWYLAHSGLEEPIDRRISSAETLGKNQPTVRADLAALFAHVESVLDTINFFRPSEKRPRMRRNLHAPFLRAGLSEQEVRSLRGVIKALMRAGRQTRYESDTR